MPALFDFSSFAQSLAGLAPGGKQARVQQELQTVAELRTREPQAEFARAVYCRKLLRLLKFLETGQMPADLLPTERIIYQNLAGGPAGEGASSGNNAPRVAIVLPV